MTDPREIWRSLAALRDRMHDGDEDAAATLARDITRQMRSAARPATTPPLAMEARDG